jgi:hypothetical protein
MYVSIPLLSENGCYKLLVDYCVSCVVCETTSVFVVTLKQLLQNFFCDCV